MSTTTFDHEAQQLAGLAAMPIELIEPNPDNPRETLRDIDELAVSIRENGLIQPIVVYAVGTPDAPRYRIRAGHRRFAAVLRLGWAKAPVIVSKPMRPDAELLAMLVENGQRANLDPIEEARALNRLKVKDGLTDKAIAVKIGRSQSHVSIRLALLELDADDQEAVRTGDLRIVDAAKKARNESGKVRRKKKPDTRHLGGAHPLAKRARARCLQLGHIKSSGSRGAQLTGSAMNGQGVGGVACGACWEHVIRADERRSMHDASAAADRCVLCDTPHDAADGAA